LVTRTESSEQDPALDALDALSEATSASIEGLAEVNAQLEDVRGRVRQGWSWHKIVSSSDLGSAMTAVARISANLGRASGAFRRCLAKVLHTEGLRITEIGSLLEVSRQRVSALLRPDRTG
jgi:hypothetical protein